MQKKYGIEDSPDLLFRDLTDWSVVEPNGFPGLPLQRSRDHSRLCRQQRADLRMAGRAWRRLRRQGAGRARRNFGRQFGAARDAQRRHGLADGADRQAGRSDDPDDAVVGQRPDAPARGRRQEGRRADSARAQDDGDLSAKRRVRAASLGIAVDNKRQDAQHPRPQGGHRRDRRFDRQRQFPPHVRSATDRGILRPGRHAVVEPGRQRRTRRHGDRRVALGALQSDRRIRLQSHQARHDRQPVRLRQSALDAGQPGVRSRPRLGPAGRQLAERHSRQHAGQALL